MKSLLKTAFLALFSIYCNILTHPAISSALPPNRVKDTGFIRQDTVETAIIQTEAVTRTSHFVLHDPERVVVDIHGAFFPGVSQSKYTRGKILSSIRTSQNQKDVVRVVLDINENSPYSYKVKQEQTDDSPGVRISFSSTKSPDPGPNRGTVADHPPLGAYTASANTAALLDDDLPDDLFEDTKTAEEESKFSISGEIRVRGTLQTEEDDAVENNQSFRNKVLLEGKYKKDVTVSVLSDYLYFSSENKTDDYDIDLYEAKWEGVEKNYGFSIGKQIIRWGKSDQISPVDTLNAQDFREFLLPDYEERKIPAWMANARLFSEYFTLEGVFIPFFEPAKLDYFGTNWSIFGHMKKELKTNQLTPSLESYVDNLAVNETEPDNEKEFAFRLHTSVKEIDMGLTFHRMNEDIPYFKSFPVKNIQVNGDFSGNNLASVLNTAVLTNEAIEVEYKRTNAFGFELETTWADLGLRGEALWNENESFLTSSLTSSRHPTFTYVLGADYTTAGNTYINFQFLHSHIYDFSPEILYFEQDSFSFLGEFRMELVSDWLQGAVKYNIALNNDSHYLSPYLKYTYITNLECIAGAGLFFGDRETWFGRFKDYDFIYLDIAYRF